MHYIKGHSSLIFPDTAPVRRQYISSSWNHGHFIPSGRLFAHGLQQAGPFSHCHHRQTSCSSPGLHDLVRLQHHLYEPLLPWLCCSCLLSQGREIWTGSVFSAHFICFGPHSRAVCLPVFLGILGGKQFLTVVVCYSISAIKQCLL